MSKQITNPYLLPGISISLILVIILFSAFSVLDQNVAQDMNYQAVDCDRSGQVLTMGNEGLPEWVGSIPGNGRDADLLAVGDFSAAEGGWVFYTTNGSNADLNGDGQGDRGLVVAEFDMSTTAAWGCLNQDVPGVANVHFPPRPGASGAAVGNGWINTSSIVAANCVGPAANLCKNYSAAGHTDWSLPSLEELNLIRINIHLQGKGNFNRNGFYWTSSENNQQKAYVQFFRSGAKILKMKNSNLRVRAVRAF